MTLKLALISAATLLAVSACGTVTSETNSSIIVDGESFNIRSRTIDGPNGAFETSSVRVGGIYYLCIPESKGDCEAAVREGLEFPFDRD